MLPGPPLSPLQDIGDEGEVPGVAPEAPPLYMAAGLNEFLKTRPL